MGFVSRSGNAKFVNIKQGQFSMKIGDQYQLLDEDLVGTLVDIAIVDDKFADNVVYKKLCLTIDDGKESFQLQMKMGSGYANSFCMLIQNADLSQPITFSVWSKLENGKNKTGMFLNQNKKALKWFYTKANPGDLPRLEQVVFKGQTLWDNSKQQEFLTDLLLFKIKPALVHPAVAGAKQPDAPPLTGPSSSPAENITELIDDLPF